MESIDTLLQSSNQSEIYEVKLFHEFIDAAIPLMNDPGTSTKINAAGLVEIVYDNGKTVVTVRQSIQHFLGRYVNRHIAGAETSNIQRSCSHKNCRCCPVLTEVPKWVEPLQNVPICCDMKNVIYGFFCRVCQKFIYVDKTTKPLRKRMAQHVDNKNAALHRHAEISEHESIYDEKNRLIYNIVVMWIDLPGGTKDKDVGHGKVVQNWELFMLWLSEANKDTMA